MFSSLKLEDKRLNKYQGNHDMNHDKMIMGEPPDLAAKPKKRLLIFVVLVVFLLVGIGTVFFVTAEKEKEPSLALRTKSKATSTQPAKTDRIKHVGKLDVHKPSKARDLPQLDTMGQEPLESPIPIAVPDTQDIELYEGEIVSSSKTLFSFPATLHFGFKSADLSSSAMVTIKEAFDSMANKEGRLILEGHTCSVGSDKSNVDLSKSRIKNVAKAFRELGLGMNIRMSLFAYGKSRPVATNETPEGRVQNRRVKIRFVPNS